MKRILILFLLLASFSGFAQLQLPYSVKLVNPKPVDFYYYETDGTPYDNTGEVTTQVISALRYIGQTFNVNGAEYWFAAGIADGDLVAKGVGGGSGTVSSGTANQLTYYSGTGTTVSATNAIPNGITATTQSTNDASSKISTTKYADDANGIVGDIYSEDFSGGIGSYTNTGSGTATYTGGRMVLSGGTLGSLSNYVIINLKSSWDNIYRIVRFTNTSNVTGEGFGIVFKSVNALNIPMETYATLNTSAAGSRGQIKIHSVTSGGVDTNVATSSNNLSYTNTSDVLEAKIVYKGPSVIQVWVSNITTPGTPVYVEYLATNLPAALGLAGQCIHSPGFYKFSAGIEIVSDVYGSYAQKKAKLARLGDSITQGSYIGTTDQRESNLLNSRIIGGVVTYACGGNTALDVYNSLDLLIAAKPSYAAIMVGINDLFNGVTLGTTSTPGTYLYDYKRILDKLVLNNIKPIILYITPITGSNTTINTWNAALLSNFATYGTVIDWATQLKNGGSVLAADYDSGDGIHMNSLGASYLAKYFVDNAKIQASKNFGDFPNINFDGSTFSVGAGTNSFSTNYFNSTVGAVTPSPIIRGGTGGLTILPDAGGVNGAFTNGAYYNQSTYKSAIYFTNVASGNGTLQLMKDGGAVTAPSLTATGAIAASSFSGTGAATNVTLNGSSDVGFSATSSSSASNAYMTLANNSSNYLAFQMFGSAYGGGKNNTGYLTSATSGGFVFAQYAATGDIAFQTTTSLTERMKISNAGLVSINGLATGLTAPTTTGTTKMVVSDANGLLSFSAIPVGGYSALNVNTSSATNSGTTETDLYRYSVPANTLSADGYSVESKLSGIYSNSGNSKTVRVYFGTTKIFDSGTFSMTTGTNAWTLDIQVIRIDGTNQKCNIKLISSSAVSTPSFVTYTASTETLSNALDLAVTLQVTGGTNEATKHTAKTILSR